METMNYVDFTCNVGAVSTPFPHFWEHTVGSCHATLALRADWQQHHMTTMSYGSWVSTFTCVFMAFYQMMMGTLVCENGEYVYSFFNTDQVFDFLLSIGVRPFVELSFMPSTLAAGGDIVFHYRKEL